MPPVLMQPLSQATSPVLQRVSRDLLASRSRYDRDASASRSRGSRARFAMLAMVRAIESRAIREHPSRLVKRCARASARSLPPIAPASVSVAMSRAESRLSDPPTGAAVDRRAARSRRNRAVAAGDPRAGSKLCLGLHDAGDEFVIGGLARLGFTGPARPPQQDELPALQCGGASRKARDLPIGRPRALAADQIRQAQALRTSGEPVLVIAETLGVSRATLYRTLAERTNRHQAQ
jgi:hypothetical protein